MRITRDFTILNEYELKRPSSGYTVASMYTTNMILTHVI